MVMMMILVIVIINHSDRGGELFVYADQDIIGCFFVISFHPITKKIPSKTFQKEKKLKETSCMT